MNGTAKSVSHEKILRLVLSAVMIGLATVLSMLTIVKMPLGGSITPLSMLPICMISIMYGTGWGLGTAFVYSLVQLGLDLGAALGWGLSGKALAVCFLVDYILAFTALGLAGAFRKKGLAGACAGIAFALAVRFVCHVISGGTVFSIWCEWSNAWVYSICYNGAFMLPELLLTMAAAVLLMRSPAVSKMIK